jgi:5-carboxymethyl-2-hydroxymuconate isomerase
MRLATIRTTGTTDTPQITVLDTGDGVWRRTDRSALDVIAGRPYALAGPVDVTPQSLLAPFRPPTVIGIGLNFRDTVEEMGWDMPQQPYLFPKLSSSVTGPYDPVVVDTTVTARADWEGELAVVIGKNTRNVTTDRALDHVFGYATANDISARDLQAADGQWVRGKGLDTFCPLGPWISTTDEIPDPQQVPIRTWHNGTLVQDGTTASMIFGVAELVSYCSRWFTLGPGDVILTGTPAGCGDFRKPPVALVPGDVVEVEVGPLGRQRNSVTAPDRVSG